MGTRGPPGAHCNSPLTVAFERAFYRSVSVSFAARFRGKIVEKLLEQSKCIDDYVSTPPEMIPLTGHSAAVACLLISIQLVALFPLFRRAVNFVRYLPRVNLLVNGVTRCSGVRCRFLSQSSRISVRYRVTRSGSYVNSKLVYQHLTFDDPNASVRRSGQV